MKKKWIASTVLALSLMGGMAAAGEQTWNRTDGAPRTPADLQRDYNQCAYEANSRVPPSVPVELYFPTRYLVHQLTLQCLEARGWYYASPQVELRQKLAELITKGMTLEYQLKTAQLVGTREQQALIEAEQIRNEYQKRQIEAEILGKEE